MPERDCDLKRLRAFFTPAKLQDTLMNYFWTGPVKIMTEIF